MATRRQARPAPAARGDKRNVKVEMRYVDINSIQPYDYNPRDNSDAIDSVANSISTFGFLIPVVIDSHGVLAAGHTRVEAAKKLGIAEVPSVLADHLTEEQINAFRLIDNKVAEIAKWDFDMLSGEIAKLGESGIQLTDFGWSREELDCLNQMVADDCLSVDGLVTAEAEDRIRRTERRAPATARFVLGELVFFIPATDYRTWVDGLRTLHDYNESDILADVKRRLGITEEE